MPTDWLTSPEDCAERILSKAGRRIVLGLPLGLGKANSIANALYRRAEADASIDLEILTALTLARPRGAAELGRRFLDPLFERLAGDYPELAYDRPLQESRLPSNIRVHEFYFVAGSRLASLQAQQAYTSANYTHAVRDLLDRGVNVIAQLVARRGTGVETELSLSCNTDLTLDLLPELKARDKSRYPVAIAAEVNDNLPFMAGPAILQPDTFDFILDGPGHTFDLFEVPKEPVRPLDYAIALRVATLIPDGGTLQIGIGGFSDALAHVLNLRQHENAAFRQLVAALGVLPDDRAGIHLDPFDEGLYACSEMLVEALLDLRRNGIIKRRATAYAEEHGLARGPMIHSAFFLGSRDLYEMLHGVADEDADDIAMTAVSFVNNLLGDTDTKFADRRKGRFVNKAMLATALGAIASDATEDGRVVSGVGGQYNFVVQAHELPDARAIIILDATRTTKGRTSSNIVWNYGHTTVPRHLRDVIVTEYGIADLRGKSDRDTIVEMLGITDSRFQDELAETAKRAGKLERGYRFADSLRRNTPERIESALEDAIRSGLLPQFPLGTAMTPVEVGLIGALKKLGSIAHAKPRLLAYALGGFLGPKPRDDEVPFLDRLDLAAPRSMQDRLMQWSVLRALRETKGTGNGS